MTARQSGFKVKAIIELEFNEDALSKAVKKALDPEARLELRGVKVDLFTHGRKIKLIIEAKDPSSFRATLNALLRLVSTLLKVIQDVKVLKEL